MLTDRILRRQVNLVRVKILEEGAVHREREVADVDASLYAALLPVILEIIVKLKVQNVPEKSFLFIHCNLYPLPFSGASVLQSAQIIQFL